MILHASLKNQMTYWCVAYGDLRDIISVSILFRKYAAILTSQWMCKIFMCKTEVQMVLRSSWPLDFSSSRKRNGRMDGWTGTKTCSCTHPPWTLLYMIFITQFGLWYSAECFSPREFPSEMHRFPLCNSSPTHTLAQLKQIPYKLIQWPKKSLLTQS